MIAFTKDMPFGGRAALVQTPMFHCGVSTAKDGLFKPRVTMIIADAVTAGGGMIKGRPAVKFIYSKSLRDADYLTMHDTIVRALDEIGTGGNTLPQAVGFIAEELRKSGTVSEVLNLLTEGDSTPADYIQQVRQHLDEVFNGVGLALCGYLAPIYKRQHGADTGMKLAVAVSNIMMLRAPDDTAAKAFGAANVALVNSLVANLAKIPQIRQPLSVILHTAMEATKGTPAATLGHIVTATRLGSTGFLLPVESLSMPTNINALAAVVANLADWLKQQSK